MKHKTGMKASPPNNSASLPKHVEGRDPKAFPGVAQRERTAESPERSPEFLRLLVDNLLDGIVVADAEGIIRFANSACENLVGFKPEELIGQTVFTLMHPDDARALRETHSHFVQNLGTTQSAELRVLHRDGSWRVVEGMATSFLDESREIAIVSVLRDISARRRAEDALAESEELFRRLSESIFDGIVIHEEGRILEINPAMLNMFGYQRAETIGRPIWQFVTPESAQLIQSRIRQGATKPYEIIAVRKDGSTFPAEGIGRDCRYQGRAARVVALRDISERKEAETALRESEERFHSLVRVAFDGFAVHENDRIIEVSPAMATILGRELSEIVGSFGMEFVTPESAQIMRRNMVSEYDKPYEITVVKKDGSTAPVEILGKSCFHQGRKARIVAFRDLTEQKRMAEALQETQERMRSVLENSPDLISSVDANGNIAFANRLLPQFKLGQVIGSNICDYAEPTHHDLIRSSIARAFASGVSTRFEATGPGVDSRASWYEIRVGPIRRDGRIVNAIVIASDITERKQMENALRKSEERYRGFVQNFQGIAFQGNMNWVPLFFHGAVEKITGYTEAELLAGKPTWHEIIHPDDLPMLYARGGVDELRSIPNFSVEREYRILRKDGQVRWLSEMIQNLCDDSGKPVLLQGTLYDITRRKKVEAELATYRDQLERLVAERTAELTRTNEQLRQEVSEHKRTEQALRDSETKFRELTELLPQTVFEFDLKGNLTFSNRHGFESFGYAKKDFDKGLSVLQLVIPEEQDRIKVNIQKILDGEKTGGHEYVALHKDGRTAPVIVYSSPIVRDDKTVGLRGIVIDITERKRAEEALQKSESELRALLEATHDAACLMDPQGNLITLNENFASRFGRQVDELVGTNVFDLLPPELTESRRQRAEEAISSRQCVYAEDEREGRFTHSSYCPIFDDKGDLIRFAVFARDITEQRQAEEQIRQLQRQQIEIEKLAATGRMAARIAHEINNPLGGIKNSFQLIKESVPKSHRHYQYVGRIESEIERITRIVRQMIDLHRPEPLLSSRFQVDKMIRDVVALLEHNAREHSVVLEADTHTARVTVTMPEDSLRQIVNNIVLNAVEASPQGGIVKISATVTGRTLLIKVSDQGSGIPEEARSKIYEPFYTTKSSRMTGGLGLGLAISKNLVEAMDGSLDFESLLGQGTTFVITLPVETSRKEARDG
ncbi:MAG: PAS domain S-box protein [bacterium]